MSDSISSVLSSIRKSGAKLGKLTDAEFTQTLTPEALSTGNLALDAITGIGGLPRGRVTELFGPPSSGKTTCALQCAALVQQAGGRVLFLDHERSLDEKYVRALGIDPDGVHKDGEPSFIYLQPRSFEEGANAFRKMMPYLDLAITDSVAAMVTTAELESDTGKVEFAARAKTMHQYMRQVTGPIVDTKTAMVFLNHVQDVIDTSPMGQRMKAQGISRQTTPGGSALKFYASLRIGFKQIGNVRSTQYDAVLNEDVSVPTQTKTKVTVVKNKVGNPFGQAELRVRFGRGFSNEWSALDVLLRHGKIKKDTGGIFRFYPELEPTNDGDYPTYAPSTSESGAKESAKAKTRLWVKGEDNVIELMQADAAFREKAVATAAELLRTGWDVQADADTIAQLKADDEDDAKATATYSEMGDVSDLEGAFK